MKREQSVDLHDREVVSEQDERGHVDDVLRAVPEMREELGCARCEEPDEVTDDNIPTHPN